MHIIFLISVTLVVFRDFIFRGLLPIPADILVGAYFPWLDFKWGYIVGVPVKNPLPSDVISILYPSRILGMEIFKSGNLPLWDPSILLGTPLLANFQSALLNPLNFLFFILPSTLAWSVQVMLQPIFISLTTYFFLRNLGISKLSSSFGGVTFAFSGFSVVWMQYNTLGHALTFFPLALLLADKISKSPKVHYVFFLSLVLTLQIFAGYPQVAIYTIAFSGIYFLFRLFYEKEKWVGKLLAFGLGVVSALALSAVQLLPSLELIKYSIRPFDATAVGGGIQFLPLQHIVTFFIPDFFGNPATGNFWGGGSYDNFAFSIAAAALFFAVVAIISKSVFTKRNAVFLLFAALSLIFATENILSSAISGSDILGFKSAVAARVLFIFSFALSVMAAIGLDKLIEGGRLKLVQKFIPLFLYLGIVISLLFLVFYTNGQTRVDFSVSLKNSVIPLATVILLTGALIFGRRQIILAVAFGLLFINILISTNKYLTFSPSSLVYPPTPVTTTLKENIGTHRFDREAGEIFPSNVWVPYGLNAASGQNALSLLSSGKYFNLVNNNGLATYSRYIDASNIESPLYDTLDIKYLAVLNRTEKEFSADSSGKPFKKFLDPRFKELGNFGTVRILENTTNLGSVWFSANTVCAENENRTIDILTQKGYSPKDLIVVNCSLGKEIEAGKVGSAEIVQELASYSRINVNTEAENYLVISKANYPGWKAYVDGAETNLYSANLTLMSLLVPSGRHIVELKYQPDSFYTGLKVSLITLIGWGVVFIVGKKYAKKI